MEEMANYPVTMALIAINVLMSLIAMNNQDVYAKSLMWPYGVKRYNQYYRFITSGFIHSNSNYFHLIFNMLTLYFFGKAIEPFFTLAGLGGKFAYIALYFLGLIASDIPTYIKEKDNYNYHSLGASGAVSAVLFAAIVFNPWSIIKIFGAFPIPAVIYGVLYLIFCVYMSKRGGDNVNHDAHFWGALFGVGFTVALVAAMRPELFDFILYQLTHPKLFGGQ